MPVVNNVHMVCILTITVTACIHVQVDENSTMSCANYKRVYVQPISQKLTLEYECTMPQPDSMSSRREHRYKADCYHGHTQCHSPMRNHPRLHQRYSDRRSHRHGRRGWSHLSDCEETKHPHIMDKRYGLILDFKLLHH